MKTILLVLLWSVTTLFGSIGSVTALKGEAELVRESGVIQAYKGIAIEVKDTLETHAISRVQVILHDETIITVGPNSMYRFEMYKEGADATVMMALDRGFFKAITGKIGKVAPERFKIKTKVATIGIRGTQFMVAVSDDEEKIGCTKGALVVETEKTTYELPAGNMLLYSDGKWSMHELDHQIFEPVDSVDEESVKTPLERTNSFMPNYQENALPQEQLLDKEHGQGL